MVEILNLGPLEGDEWGFTGTFDRENGGIEYCGLYESSQHTPGGHQIAVWLLWLIQFITLLAGGFLTDHFPSATKAIWDFEGEKQSLPTLLICWVLACC